MQLSGPGLDSTPPICRRDLRRDKGKHTEKKKDRDSRRAAKRRERLEITAVSRRREKKEIADRKIEGFAGVKFVWPTNRSHVSVLP